MAAIEQSSEYPDVPLAPLRKRADFIRLRSGKRVSCKYFTLQAKKNQNSNRTARYGLTVTTKVGNAVERNRIKRRYRPLFRDILPVKGHQQYDYVLIARRDSLMAQFSILANELINALDRVHANGAKA